MSTIEENTDMQLDKNLEETDTINDLDDAELENEGSLKGLMWQDPRTKRWIPAVYHSEIRDRLIAEASLQGEYTHRRAAGKLPNDVTSFLASQKSWGTKRADWPPIVHIFIPGNNDRLGGLPEPWITAEGRVVLSIDNSPVLNYSELPAAISSKVEPVFMEAWFRLNVNIDCRDIRARMPDNPQSANGKWDGEGVDPIRLIRLRAAVARFREISGCITWKPKKGTKARVQYLKKIMPAECLSANSVKGFRDLNDHELAGLRLGKARRRDENENEHDEDEKTNDEDEDEGLPDCRMSVPRSSEHTRLIEFLLLPATQMFHQLTGIVAPETDKSASYQHQVQALQRALEDWYLSKGFAGPFPELVHLFQLNIDGVRWSSEDPPASLYSPSAWAEFGPLLNRVLKSLDKEFVLEYRRAMKESMNL